ncbi:MAG: transketolase [Nitrospinota bacterium]
MVKKTENMEELKEIARRMRIDIVKMINAAGSGHPGGSLSAIDIIVSLYFSRMNHSPSDKPEARRDRFVLSKGHAAPALYAVLAECGYFDKSELLALRKEGSILSGHAYAATPGVEVTAGSLGQGLSQANGLALANRLNNDDSNVYCVIGDGEMQEGQIWEAAMTAAHYKLGSVITFLDNNGLQIDGPLDVIMNIKPAADKWRAFGWHVQEIDGHDFAQILEAVDNAKKEMERPSMIVAKTVKGKGVSFMENQVKWHGTAPNDEELKKAIEELSTAPLGAAADHV